MVCGSSRDHIPLRNAAFYLEAEPRFRVGVLRVDGRRHTHNTSERRAARQSSFTRTTNATTPQVRCCVVDPRQARSHGLPGPVLVLHEREREVEKQAARKTLRI